MRCMKTKRILSGIMTLLILAMGVNLAYADDAAWTCASCGQAGNTGNFCPNCGSTKPQDSTWTCTSCGQEGNTGSYCANCGSPKAEDSPHGISGELSVGDTVVLGTYEQDNLLYNGEEPIEWVVLTVQNGKAMLISKFILDYKDFNKEYTSVTWSECDLREWLNDDFYSTVFTSDEKGMIVDYTSESSTDHVFILSLSEAKSFSEDIILEPLMTEYAKAQGLITEWYWLRTPGKAYPAGYTTYHAATVNAGILSEISEYGHSVASPEGVRPCIWIEY